ncbi:hypothetical protein [Vibrio sp. JPW-9-11-11]|nr:hypothetical protein [Vibrio sp. JPW-9-11-11]
MKPQTHVMAAKGELEVVAPCHPLLNLVVELRFQPAFDAFSTHQSHQ